MNIELTDKEFRRLLDLVYIGNWILNSTREKDRFEDYDILQEKLFAQCAKNGMNALISRWQGHIFPSPAYENGGIHEAIADYEDASKRTKAPSLPCVSARAARSPAMPAGRRSSGSCWRLRESTF